MKSANQLCAMICGIMMLSLPVTARVVTYPVPEGMPRAEGITITADGEEVFPHEVQVNHNRRYMRDPLPPTESTPVAFFDFSDSVQVMIRREGVSSVTVRPLSLGIIPEFSGSTMTFTLYKPAKVSIEFNSDIHGALHLFAGGIPPDPPEKGDPGVRYFGPGIHEVQIDLESDQTVYLAGGAVLRGGIIGENVRNVRILGRGMLNGGPIRLNNCSNIEINGIHNFRPNERGWMVNIRGCQGIRIIDYRSIGCGPNSDGIDPCSSQDVVIRDCFLRQWDDIFAIKGTDQGDVRGVEISDCVLWSDLAQVFEIGYETRCESISDVYIHDCTVIHALHLPVISIHNGDRASVSNIRYENIMIEHGNLHAYDPYIIDLWVGIGHWTRDEERGRISGVSIKNVSFLSGSFAGNRIAGYNETHKVEDITIENLYIYGKPVLTPEQGRFQINEHTGNIEIIHTNR